MRLRPAAKTITVLSSCALDRSYRRAVLRTPGGRYTQVMPFYHLAGNVEHDTGCHFDFQNRDEI